MDLFHHSSRKRVSAKIAGVALVTLVLWTNGASAALPTIGGCTVFTADDHWNKDISAEAVDQNWTSKLNQSWGTSKIKVVFGTYHRDRAGVPVNVVPATQPMVPITYDRYGSESDSGPFPFPGPDTVSIQGGDPACASQTDCHVLVVQQETCKLYEGWACRHANRAWSCGSGAVFDLKKNSYGQRPLGYTSAEAAGMPMFAGLIRYEEVAAGEIRHALRFQTPCTSSFIPPASHEAKPEGCSGDAPPLGMRIRLKADFDISGFNKESQVVLRALKKYGAILADNNYPDTSYILQADVDPGWAPGQLYELWEVPNSAFEAVKTYQ